VSIWIGWRQHSHGGTTTPPAEGFVTWNFIGAIGVMF
jgi:hypothetical protein